MVLIQDNLVEIIVNEIEDRSSCDHVPQSEIDGLIELRTRVQSGQPLDFNQYQWLCDLVSAHTEINL